MDRESLHSFLRRWLPDIAFAVVCVSCLTAEFVIAARGGR